MENIDKIIYTVNIGYREFTFTNYLNAMQYAQMAILTKEDEDLTVAITLRLPIETEKTTEE